MFSVKLLVWWKFCILFWSTVNRLCSSLLKEEEFMSFINFTSEPSPPLLDVWSQIQCCFLSLELSCLLSSLLLYHLLLPQQTVSTVLSNSVHSHSGSWPCWVGVGWMSGLCLCCCLLLGFRWLWNSSTRGASPQHCKLTSGRLWDITAISWLHRRGLCTALHLWHKWLLCYVFWEYEWYSDLQSRLPKESLSAEKSPSDEQQGEVTLPSAFFWGGILCTSQISV